MNTKIENYVRTTRAVTTMAQHAALDQAAVALVNYRNTLRFDPRNGESRVKYLRQLYSVLGCLACADGRQNVLAEVENVNKPTVAELDAEGIASGRLELLEEIAGVATKMAELGLSAGLGDAEARRTISQLESLMQELEDFDSDDDSDDEDDEDEDPTPAPAPVPVATPPKNVRSIIEEELTGLAGGLRQTFPSYPVFPNVISQPLPQPKKYGIFFSYGGDEASRSSDPDSRGEFTSAYEAQKIAQAKSGGNFRYTVKPL